MINQIRAEIIKIRSTRTTLGLVIGMVVLVVAITTLTGLLADVRNSSSPEDQKNLLGIGGIAGVFAGLAGILVVTSETRFGTIRPTYLVNPSWYRILGAKVTASFLAGVVFAIAGTIFSYVIGRVCLSGRGIPYSLDGSDLAWLLVGSIVGSGLWGAIGVGVGTIVRNQIGSVIAFLAWVFVLENLVFALAPSVGRYGPLEANNGFQGLRADHLLAPGLGGLVMLAWASGLVAIGIASTTRRDVA